MRKEEFSSEMLPEGKAERIDSIQQNLLQQAEEGTDKIIENFVGTDHFLYDFEELASFLKERKGESLPEKLLETIQKIGDHYIEELKKLGKVEEKDEIISEYTKREHLENVTFPEHRKRMLIEGAHSRALASYDLFAYAGGDKQGALERFKKLKNLTESLLQKPDLQFSHLGHRLGGINWAIERLEEKLGKEK